MSVREKSHGWKSRRSLGALSPFDVEILEDVLLQAERYPSLFCSCPEPAEGWLRNMHRTDRSGTRKSVATVAFCGHCERILSIGAASAAFPGRQVKRPYTKVSRTALKYM